MTATQKSIILGTGIGVVTIISLEFFVSKVIHMDFFEMLLSLEGILAPIVFTAASALFAAWTVKKTRGNLKMAALYGIIASLLTNLTFGIVFLLTLYLFGTFTASALPAFLLCYLIYSLVLGGIPMIVLGAVFGLLIQQFIKVEPLHTIRHDIQ